MLSNAVLHFLGFGATTAAKKILDNNGDCFPSWLKPYNNAKNAKITIYAKKSTMETTPKFCFFRHNAKSLWAVNPRGYIMRRGRGQRTLQTLFPITCYQKHFLKMKNMRLIAQASNTYFNRKANEQTKHFL